MSRKGYTRAGCDGWGFYNCYCGGDFCVCSYNGEIECFGCPDCEPGDYEFDGQWDDAEDAAFQRAQEKHADFIRCPRIEDKSEQPKTGEEWRTA